MTEQQIVKLAALLVEHQAEFAKLSTKDAQWAIQNTKSAIALCVEAITNRPGPILSIVSRYIISPAQKLVIDEGFVDNYKYSSKSVKTFHVGGDFSECFLGKTEVRTGGPYATTGLRSHILNRESEGGPIIDELGEDKAESTLAEIIALVEDQSKDGRIGGLYNDKANNFFVRDINGVLRAVRVIWRGTHWSLDAIITSSKFRVVWNKGEAVFSH